jgi:hypothetical protein
MRAPRALLVVLIAGLLTASAVAFAPPSSAGGPTSVLLVDTASQRATALYTSDPRYERLSELVGAGAAPVADGSAPGVTGGTWTPGSGGITATWLMHDVVVWRVDHIFVTAGGGVTIGSVSDLSGISAWGAKAAWHRASDPKALTSLLAGLGLGLGATAASTPGTAAPAAATPVVAPARPASSPAVRPTVAGPLWGLTGLAVGAGLMLAGTRLRRLTRRHPGGDDDDVVDPDLAASAEVLRS